MIKKILEQASDITTSLRYLSIDDKIDCINKIKLMLHEASPFNSQPVDCVLWVKNETVKANDYNPNSVAPPEMELLRISIANDGYTQPIVSMDNSDGTREVIDGFHRNRVGKECEDIQSKVHGYLPVVTIRESQSDLNNRVASTIRHNRARGKHKVESMSDIVVDLKRRNWSPEKIAKELGMDSDEVLRLSQISGLVEMFNNKDFSIAWEAEVLDNENIEEIE
jgi:ParB-like chromosome segregation protein Spo0J